MVEVSELTGAQLDYYVARAESVKWPAIHEHEGRPDWCALGGNPHRVYAPSTDWAQGGPLIEKYRFMLSPTVGAPYICRKAGSISESFGDTPLQAICRAVVRAAFGDEVEEVGNA